MTLCSWCLLSTHTVQSCPQLAATSEASAHGIIDPMTVEDVNDRLALRTIGYRTYSGQLERLCKEQGVEIPDEIAALNPDRFFEAA